MQPVQDNNTRWILEQERQDLIRTNLAFDERFGTFAFFFLTGVETFALLAHFTTLALLLCCRRAHNKTNFLVVCWSMANFLLLFEQLSRRFSSGHEYSKEVEEVAQIIGGLGRNYGTALAAVWLYSRYFPTPKRKYDWILYFLMSLPALFCFAILVYYFQVNRYVYESYAPLSDCGNLIVYFLVALMAVGCTILDLAPPRQCSYYAGLIALVNLVSNVPICLLTIMLRFFLDEGWVHRLHMYFLDFAANLIGCSDAFVVLLLVVLYNEQVRRFTCRAVMVPEKVPLEESV